MRIYPYLRLIRISHWIKNFFVFAPLIFSQHLLDLNYFIDVLLAFFTFSLASSLIYVFNDIIDADSDRMHPSKKSRPIASGEIKVSSAWTVVVIIFIAIIPLLFLFPISFLLTILFYIILNIFYTTVLKHIVIIDLLCIAAGFMLRVLGGAFVIDVYVSKWLILTTLFISLFLAIMKRRSELAHKDESSRRVLNEYSQGFLDQISSTSAAGVIICYALYSVSDRTIAEFGTEKLVFTTIFVVFGVFRYMYLVYRKAIGENATEVMLTDVPMILNIMLYIASVVGIIYFENL